MGNATLITRKAVSAEFSQLIYYGEDGKCMEMWKDKKRYRREGECAERFIALYDVTYEETFTNDEGEIETVICVDEDFRALKGADVVAEWQKVNDDFVREHGEWMYYRGDDGKRDVRKMNEQYMKYDFVRRKYNAKLKEEHGCSMKCFQNALETVVDGKKVYFYTNSRGATVEIVEVRPNTFEDGFYYTTGCTVDIDVNIYNDDFSVKIPRTLSDVDTGISCGDDYFEGYIEGELDYILSWEDSEGNYDGPEKDKAFYLAAKRCRDEDLDFCDEYDWRDFRTEEDYEEYCWSLITETDWTFDDMSRLDAIDKGIEKIGNSRKIFEVVDVEGTFQIYDAAVNIGDGLLYGDTLCEGRFSISGIKTGEGEEDMMRQTVDILCKWVKKNGYDKQNYVCINKHDFYYGDPYLTNSWEQKTVIEED